MAIIKCENCGKKYSDRAPGCPSCNNSKTPTLKITEERNNHETTSTQIPIHGLSSTKNLALACLIFILIFGCIGLYFLSFLKKENQQYEYAIIAPKDNDLAEELDAAGKMGWEIISSRRAISDGEGIYEIILKKTKSEPRY